MKLALSLQLLLASASIAAAAAVNTKKSRSPQRISYTSLSDSSNNNLLLLDALTQDGYVSITDIRSQQQQDGLHFREMKHNLMSNLDECLHDIGDDYDVPLQSLEDGTIRRSFATVTLPYSANKQQQPIQLLEQFLSHNPNQSAACHAFHEGLSSFRSTVDEVTHQFAARLSAELGMSSPLLLSNQGNHHDYENFASVVRGGEHLEHFHSYQKDNDGTRNGGDASSDDDVSTVELHTDQGLFIAFTPGMLVDHHQSGSSSEQQSIELSSGFYIQDSTSGQKVLLDFTQEDDLVFMLGEGVNQIINAQLRLGSSNEDGKMVLLRATPHALSLRNVEQPRVWYGRMVLPPNDAYLPEMEKTMTFGQLRQVFVESTSKGEDIPAMMGIGCSSNSKMVITTTSRSLSGEEEEEEEEGGHGVVENQCAEDEMFCWFRCMALTEETMTCDERKLGLQCVDPRGMVVEGGAGHGDYFPACTNHTHITNPITPYPQIEQQDTDMCTADLWAEFNSQDEYTHMISLKPDPTKQGPETNLFWTITESEDGQKKLKARLTFNDVFGWLAIGFANEFDSVHNGMNGGKVLLMKPGGNYSPVTGLDLSVGPNIGAYVIDDTDSAFRHWVDTETVAEGASHEHTDCFTALTFESDSISGQTFNLEGTDQIIWAGNSNDYYVGYHSPNSRGRLTINWMTGEVEFFTSKPAWGAPEDDADDASDGELDTLGSSSKMDDGSSGSIIGTSIGLAIVIISIAML